MTAVAASALARLAVFREALSQAIQTLKAWPWLDTFRTLRLRFREDQLGLTAGSLTFTTLISLVPLATVVLAVFAAFPVFSSFEAALEKYFLQALVPDGIARPVLAALRQFAGKASRLGTLGFGLLLLTALALMLTIDRTLNGIWRVRRPRPIAQRVLVYWAAATLGPLLLGVSLSLTSYALSVSSGWVRAMPGSVELLLESFEFMLFAVAVSGLFHHVPNTHVRWRHALAGGVFVALGFEVAKRLLGWYLRQMPTYAMVYGAFATVPILLVWIYLAWVIVLLGAVIAAYAPSLQMRVSRRADVPGLRFELALALLRELRNARLAGRQGCNSEELAAALHCDPLQIEPVLDALAALDWVGRLEEAGSGRHVLLYPADAPAAPLIEHLLINHGPTVAAFWNQARLDSLTLRELLEP